MLMVVPNTHATITAAGNEEVVLGTDIEAHDFALVSRELAHILDNAIVLVS
jgi:hypothetical protein